MSVFDLYCWGFDISRLTARELGWVRPDGGPASELAYACQHPSSQFGCDSH